MIRRKENPAAGTTGPTARTGQITRKGKTIMNAITLPFKEKAAARSTRARGVTEAQQLQEWLSRGRLEVFTVTTNLTPDLARLLLANNESNRPVNFGNSTRSVTAYANAMRRGEWLLNGETLIVSRDGQLNDGQHRCYAAIEADAAVPILITFGVERDTRHTVDQGNARSPGHILAMAGETNTNHLAGALQMLWATDSDLTLNARPSMEQLLDTLARHPGAREALKAVGSLAGHYRLSHGYLAAAHYLCRKGDAFSADQFLGLATTGLHIANVNSPVARLRKQFEEHNAKRKKIDRIEQAALYIKAFNNFRQGRTGPIAWRNTGPSPEAFPAVGG